MAGYKETPRQKMIAMMYLVLYALLALNVSKQVLDAFLVVNENVEDTNTSLSTKIAATYDRFETQYQLNPDKVGPFWDKAKEVRRESVGIVKYLQHLKLKLVEVSERKDSAYIVNHYYFDTLVPDSFHPGEMKKAKELNLRIISTKDRYNNVTNYMIGVGNSKNGEAYRLSKKMTRYRDSIIRVMNLPENTTKIGLITNYQGKKKIIYYNADRQKQDWENHNFYYTILAADITLVNKIISEVKMAEFDALNYLYSSITEKDYKFDHVEAKVIPTSTYVLEGNSYKAQVLVAAYDTKTKPNVRILSGVDSITDNNISRAQLVQGKGGVVKIEMPAKREGIHKYAGIIEMVDPKTNQRVKYNFKGKYMVAPPSLTVAPLRMNVFYLGVENPVSITSPGLSSDQIHPSISAGKLYKKGRNWIVKLSHPVPGNKVYVSATAMIEGKNILLGKSAFRIKRVPSPAAEIAGISNGVIDKNTLLAAHAIIPDMKDFLFDNYYFKITSYTFGTLINGDYIPKNVKGNTFSPEVMKIIRNAKHKQKFFFENIQAVGPDGSIRTLNPINLEIK
jgi:gliding motility-associated protein GldM